MSWTDCYSILVYSSLFYLLSSQLNRNSVDNLWQRITGIYGMFIQNNISDYNFYKENEDLKLEIQKYIPIKSTD